jgi:hypothetical protein
VFENRPRLRFVRPGDVSFVLPHDSECEPVRANTELPAASPARCIGIIDRRCDFRWS